MIILPASPHPPSRGSADGSRLLRAKSLNNADQGSQSGSSDMPRQGRLGEAGSTGSTAQNNDDWFIKID